MKATVCRQEIEHNGVIYRTNGNGWQVQMFGTYGPGCKGIPSYRFCSIPESKVPDEVQRSAKS